MSHCSSSANVKVLFYHQIPFALAHGGLQTQILQTCNALARLGVEIDFLRWWDEHQAGDLLHFFGRMPRSTLQLAQKKGMKVVMTDLLAGQSSRPPWRLKLQCLVFGALRRAAPRAFITPFHWESYRLADACVALTSCEARVLAGLFGAPPANIHVVPNGVEDIFLHQPPAPRGPWLVCAATLRKLKRVVELAEAAVLAQTPLWVIGKPYADSDPYAQRFVQFARQHPSLIRYEGAIDDRAKLARVYREARGFVLLSAMESMSLSALEAAACECPLLLSRLPWAATVFGPNASYCPVTSSAARTAGCLRQFYDAAPALKPPPRPLTWLEAGRQLQRLYETLLHTSR